MPLGNSINSIDGNKSKEVHNWVTLLIVILLFFLLNQIFQKGVYGQLNYNILLAKGANNKAFFWGSSYGIALKVCIDIATTSFLFFILLYFEKIRSKLSKLVSIVAIAYLIFFLQIF